MSSKLATALKTVLAERGLAGNVSGAAKVIGIASPGLKKVLDGAAKPNKATVGRYQAYLGLSDADFAELMGGAPPRTKKINAEKSVTGRVRRNRKPAAETEEVPAGAGDARDDDFGGEKDVTRAIVPTTQSTYAQRDNLIVEAALERALTTLDSVFKDDLALRVHSAPAGVRALISRILG